MYLRISEIFDPKRNWLRKRSLLHFGVFEKNSVPFELGIVTFICLSHGFVGALDVTVISGLRDDVLG